LTTQKLTEKNPYRLWVESSGKLSRLQVLEAGPVGGAGEEGGVRTKVGGQVQASLLLLAVHKDGVPVGRPVRRADQMQLSLKSVLVCVDPREGNSWISV
jgi:hypothetical protein